jgi:hypothetical protein
MSGVARGVLRSVARLAAGAGRGAAAGRAGAMHMQGAYVAPRAGPAPAELLGRWTAAHVASTIARRRQLLQEEPTNCPCERKRKLLPQAPARPTSCRRHRLLVIGSSSASPAHHWRHKLVIASPTRAVCRHAVARHLLTPGAKPSLFKPCLAPPEPLDGWTCSCRLLLAR